MINKLKFLFVKWILRECPHLCHKCIYNDDSCIRDYEDLSWKELVAKYNHLH